MPRRRWTPQHPRQILPLSSSQGDRLWSPWRLEHITVRGQQDCYIFFEVPRPSDLQTPSLSSRPAGATLSSIAIRVTTAI